MKKILCLIALSVFSIFALGCQDFDKQVVETEKQEIEQQIEEENEEEELLELHNEIRKSKMVPAFELDKNLCEYAMEHAKKMDSKNKLYHSSMKDLRKVNNSLIIGENIAWGQKNSEEVFESWMNSFGHKRNIMNKLYKKIGIGHYGDYWCVVFTN